MRGKYSLSNRKYIKTLVKDMTEYEQEQIMTQTFEYLWCELWKNNEPNPRDKIRMSPEKWKHSVIKEDTAMSVSPPSDSEEDGDTPTTPPMREEGGADNVYGDERIAGANSVGDDWILRSATKENGGVCGKDVASTEGSVCGEDTYYDNGKMNTKDKFNILQKGLVFNQKRHFTIAEIVDEVRKEQKIVAADPWKEPEWGFCKGRRNYKENDFDCAVREMQEETGYSKDSMTPVKNINTFEEIFIGSNFKCYKHKYYLMYMTYEDSLKTGVFEKTEVSCIRWASLNECLSLIRSYNVEKKRMIANIDNALSNYAIFESR
jgi:8-oxo-dGTP pyrophosphatase MutT (NUDIX family)